MCTHFGVEIRSLDGVLVISNQLLVVNSLTTDDVTTRADDGSGRDSFDLSANLKRLF